MDRAVTRKTQVQTTMIMIQRMTVRRTEMSMKIIKAMPIVMQVSDLSSWFTLTSHLWQWSRASW